MVPAPAQRALIVAAALMTRGRLSSAKAHGRLRKIDRRAEKGPLARPFLPYLPLLRLSDAFLDLSPDFSSLDVLPLAFEPFFVSAMMLSCCEQYSQRDERPNVPSRFGLIWFMRCGPGRVKK